MSVFLAVLLLLAVAATTCGRRHHIRKGTGLLIGESEEDVRDNVFNYDEQGGGEEDEVSVGRSDCCCCCCVWVQTGDDHIRPVFQM